MYRFIWRLSGYSTLEKMISSMIIRKSSSLSGLTKPVNFGVCFDIDGVIARGYVPFSEASKAYELLTSQSGKLCVPSCFVTNALSRNVDKAAQLTEWLRIRVDPEQMVMAQGPLEMYAEYHHKNSLLIGQGSLRQIATDMGFTNVYLMDDLTEAYPLLDVADHEKRTYVATSQLTEKELPGIEVILLLGEPKHWECQLQVLIDVLLTNGKPSYKSRRVNYQTIPVIGCNLDLQYAHRATFPRFGHGAFVLCLETLFKKLTGNSLEYCALLGKPSEVTFRYAEHCLNKLSQSQGSPVPVQRMYMIGDNIEVDIAGANLYQRYIDRSASHDGYEIPASRILPNNGKLLSQTVREVYGILVKTGVSSESSTSAHSHQDFVLDNDLLQPHIVVDNVLDAVEYIIQKESYLI